MITLVNFADIKNNDTIEIKSNEYNLRTTHAVNKMINKEVILMNQFNVLYDEFNKSKLNNNLNEMAAKVKEMRTVHGKIVECFFNTIKDTKNMTDEEYYLLSTLDSSMTTTRKILNEVELYIGSPKENKEVHISTGSTEFVLPKSDKKQTDDHSSATIISGGSGHELEVNNPNLPSIVLFYADWCGHCRNFKPTWNEFKNQMKQYGGKINVIDTNESDIMANYGVSSYPTIKFFNNIKNKENSIDYNNRDLDYLITTTKTLAKL